MPEGWEAVQAADGRTYFWNLETDESTWTDPRIRPPSGTAPSPTPATLEAFAPPGFAQLIDGVKDGGHASHASPQAPEGLIRVLEVYVRHDHAGP